jgi:hypothetical protein
MIVSSEKKHKETHQTKEKETSNLVPQLGCKTKELTDIGRCLSSLYLEELWALEATATGGSGVQVVTLRTTETGGATC